jgi:sodium transport system permease protein
VRTLAAVVRKELLDHVRDKRSMLSALIFPLLGPVVFVAMFTVIADWLRNDKPLEVAVVGRENAPNLVGYLQRHGAHVTPAPDDREKKVEDGDLDVVLTIPKDFGTDFEAGHRASVTLSFDSSHNVGEVTVHRTRLLLNAYAQEIGALRLLARGVGPEIAAPVEVEDVDLASPQKRAANMINMVPFFLLLAAFLGGMHVAIDTTAGERERGSLEPLLLNPVPRWSLTLGKWIATTLMSWIGLAVSLIGFSIALRQIPLADMGLRAELGVREIGGILATILPMTLFGAAVLMLVATFARSFKEAQTYCTVLQMVPMIPGLMMTLSPVKPATWMMAVPTLGQSILISQVMRGEASRPLWFIMAFVSSVVLGLAALGGCVRLLRHERIIFGR